MWLYSLSPKIEPARQLVYVEGAVPGNNGCFVRMVDAVKGTKRTLKAFI